MIEKVEGHCCLMGATCFPLECPWHPRVKPSIGPGQTVTVCPRCDGRGARRLRGAERVRDAMGWPREGNDLPCTECHGNRLVVVDEADLDERQKPKPPRGRPVTVHPIDLRPHIAQINTDAAALAEALIERDADPSINLRSNT